MMMIMASLTPKSGDENIHDIHRYFNQPDHLILSMRVRIIEKIYHRTNNPNLATLRRRQKGDYWIRELGTVCVRQQKL
jgi:hypothetical protein